MFFLLPSGFCTYFLRRLLEQIPILALLCLCKHLTWCFKHSPDECRDAADVFRLGSERRRDWCLCFGQRQPDVCGSQGPAVIGPVPTHAHSVAAGKAQVEKSIQVVWIPCNLIKGFKTATRKAPLMRTKKKKAKVAKFTVVWTGQ